MNLQTNRLYRVFFFLFTITFVSCEKPNDIGLNLQEENEQLGTHFNAQQPVTLATVFQPDSLVAFKNSPIVVGKVSDNEFGEITATHYTEIGLNGTNLNFNVAANAQADSMVLVLAYSGSYYGDTTATIKLNVLKLAENFVDAKTYYTNTTLATGDNIGSVTFKPTSNRVKNASRLLRIKLDQNFANALLGKSGSTDLATQSAFREFWKGIAITADPSSASGSLVSFNTIPDSAGTPLAKVAGINLYYKDRTGKSQFHNFSLSGQYYFNGVKTNLSGSPLNALVGNPTQKKSASETNNQAFIQEQTGIKTHLTFPELTKFKEEGNIYINHAELVLPVKAGSTGGNGKAMTPPTLFLYESTTNNRILETTGGVSYTIQRGDASAYGITRPLRVTYNAAKGTYTANITSYVQALLDKNKANNGIILSATPEDSFTATAAGVPFPGNATVNRTILDATGVQVRIYYSKIN